jgi:hypothetical protein
MLGPTRSRRRSWAPTRHAVHDVATRPAWSCARADPLTVGLITTTLPYPVVLGAAQGRLVAGGARMPAVLRKEVRARPGVERRVVVREPAVVSSLETGPDGCCPASSRDSGGGGLSSTRSRSSSLAVASVGVVRPIGSRSRCVSAGGGPVGGECLVGCRTCASVVSALAAAPGGERACRPSGRLDVCCSLGRSRGRHERDQPVALPLSINVRRDAHHRGIYEP